MKISYLENGKGPDKMPQCVAFYHGHTIFVLFARFKKPILDLIVSVYN